MDIEKLISVERWEAEPIYDDTAIGWINAHNNSLTRIESIVGGHLIDVERHSRRFIADLEKQERLVAERDERVKELEAQVPRAVKPSIECERKATLSGITNPVIKAGYYDGWRGLPRAGRSAAYQSGHAAGSYDRVNFKRQKMGGEMNTKLQILAENAGLSCDGTPDSWDSAALKRFAELIIEDCVELLRANTPKVEDETLIDYCPEDIDTGYALAMGDCIQYLQNSKLICETLCSECVHCLYDGPDFIVCGAHEKEETVDNFDQQLYCGYFKRREDEQKSKED